MKKLFFLYFIWWFFALFFVIAYGIYFSFMACIYPPKLPLIYKKLCYRLYRLTCYILPIEIIGMDQLSDDTHYIFTANHQSFSATPLLMAVLGGHRHYPRFVMKEGIRFFPILNIYAHYLKFLYLNRQSPRKALQQIRQAALEHTAIQDWVLFPEGTRAPIGSILPPKSAGLYWIMQSFPHHPWVDCTILYTAKGIKVHITLMPKTHDKKQLEHYLHAQFSYKTHQGLIPLEDKNTTSQAHT